MDFEDEFTVSTSVKKPETPAQYVKLDDAELVKRDLDTFPDFLKEKALDKYKLISFIEQENSGGWTQNKLDPISSIVRWRIALLHLQFYLLFH